MINILLLYTNVERFLTIQSWAIVITVSSSPFRRPQFPRFTHIHAFESLSAKHVDQTVWKQRYDCKYFLKFQKREYSNGFTAGYLGNSKVSMSSSKSTLEKIHGRTLVM